MRIKVNLFKKRPEIHVKSRADGLFSKNNCKNVIHFTKICTKTHQNPSIFMLSNILMVFTALDSGQTTRFATRKVEKVELTNAGDLSLFFIGVGAAFAKTLNQNNILIIKGEDHLLVDCGSRCSQALFAKGLQISSIQNFVITHSHADHIGGLEEAGLLGRYVTHQKPNMVINDEYQKILWERSLRGGSEMSEEVPLTFENLWQPLRPKLMPRSPRETWEIDVGSINIKLPRTKHFPDTAPTWKESFWSVGVIIDNRILYTSDTRFDRDLLESFDDIYNFDIIYHDTQMFTGGVHASLDELKELPDRLRAKIILMHYGDNWKTREQEALDAGFHSWAIEGYTHTFPPRFSQATSIVNSAG